MELLVDGNGLVSRLWFARSYDVPRRFVATVERVAAGVSAIVAWDTPHETWRKAAMPGYKAGRGGKPLELQKALAECKALAMPGLRHASASGYEADDLIATLARWAIATGDEVRVLSYDKDFAQLVGPCCELIDAYGKVTTAADVEARWGVPPEKIRHLFSWMGDATDGLPGVHGVGKKRAVPHALAGEIGDALTYKLVGLANVPAEAIRWGAAEREVTR